MVSRFVAVAPTVPLSELAILARQSPQPFYPVVANGAPDGIVTTADLAHLILKSSPARKPSPSRWRLDLG
jgi:CBS domain-containing protein